MTQFPSDPNHPGAPQPYGQQPYSIPPGQQPQQPFPTAVQTKRRTWPWVVGAVVAALIFGVAIGSGGDDDDTAALAVASVSVEPSPEPEPEPSPEPEPEPETTTRTVTATPTPEPEPEPEEGAYGSDPVLDALQDDCAAGDSDACDRLFTDSPLGSEYEDFARERGGTYLLGGGDSSDALTQSDEFYRTILELAWSQQSASDQQDFCDGIALSSDFMFETFTEAADQDIPRAVFDEFFGGQC